MSDATIIKTAPAPGDLPEDFTLDDLRDAVTEDEVAAFEANAADIEFDPKVESQPAPEQPAITKAAEPDPIPKLAEVPDISAAQALVDKLENEIEALAAKYDEGELTKQEWLAQQREIINKQAEAAAQIQHAQRVIAENAQTVEQRWFAGLDAFKAAGNEALWTPEHFNGWDSALRSVSSNAQYSNLPFERQFELAHNMYAAHYLAMTGKALPTGVGAKAQGEFKMAVEPLQPKTEPREDAPRTLAGMNGNLATALTDGTIASLMSADPERAEDMLARLSEDDFAKLAEAV